MPNHRPTIDLHHHPFSFPALWTNMPWARCLKSSSVWWGKLRSLSSPFFDDKNWRWRDVFWVMFFFLCNFEGGVYNGFLCAFCLLLFHVRKVFGEEWRVSIWRRCLTTWRLETTMLEKLCCSETKVCVRHLSILEENIHPAVHHHFWKETTSSKYF